MSYSLWIKSRAPDRRAEFWRMAPEATDRMMRTYPVFAILPVKSFDRAKSRLAPLLSPAERATLARIMLEDVLTSLNKARGLARAVVVTDDSAVAALAGSYGAAVVGGGAADGINVAINRGIATLPISTPCGVIVVPTDIPHIQPRDVETLAGRVATRASILLVPASRDDGTNILAYSPHDSIRPSFGKASFPRHIAGVGTNGVISDRHLRTALDVLNGQNPCK
jgi:2-phospho-L-lactate guanylyltransferase